MGTSAPSKLPDIFIRGAGIADAVLDVLRLRTKARVDDELFDRTFVMEEGDAECLHALLTAKLRGAFLARARQGEFTFWLRDGEASIAWKTGVVGSLVRADVCASSVELLVVLRDTLGGLRLLLPT